MRRLYDGVGGTNSSLDIRGFGEASKSNSLILVNGIRLNDIDMSNVNLSYIPLTQLKGLKLSEVDLQERYTALALLEVQSILLLKMIIYKIVVNSLLVHIAD